MTESVKTLVTMHSSETMKQITEKKMLDLDLFRRISGNFRFSYYIYKEENEQAVLTFNLSLL